MKKLRKHDVVMDKCSSSSIDIYIVTTRVGQEDVELMFIEKHTLPITTIWDISDERVVFNNSDRYSVYRNGKQIS